MIPQTNAQRTPRFIELKHKIQACNDPRKLEGYDRIVEFSRLSRAETDMLRGYVQIRIGVLTSPAPNPKV